MGNIEIAREIMNQLGGHKFTSMTGAHDYVAIKTGLQFGFRGSTKANKCRITLLGDTYKVEFFNLRAGACKPVANFDDVYDNMLQSIFTYATGLDCKL